MQLFHKNQFAISETHGVDRRGLHLISNQYTLNEEMNYRAIINRSERIVKRYDKTMRAKIAFPKRNIKEKHDNGK